MFRKLLCATVLVITGTGCATIQEQSRMSVAENQPLVAGVGDIVLKVNVEKSLPNAFGKADLFGRTTPTGLITLSYGGVENGSAILIRDALDIETGATTMNSSPLVIPNNSTTTYSGRIGNDNFQGTARTTGTPTVIQPKTPNALVNQRASIKLEVSKDSLPQDLIVDNFIVTITDFTSHSINYSVRKKPGAVQQ